MEKSKKPIGIFDSGVGGLTVMKELKSALPYESMVYFGDTARVPYGNRSAETIVRYSIENVIFLMQQNIKLLVVACNTASSYALEKLQQIFTIPIIDTIEPGAKKAAASSKSGRIAILGTRATVNAKRYEHEILKSLPSACITGIPCPLFVPLVEEKFLSHAATSLIVKEYLRPIHNLQIDTVVLGCTHYPLIKKMIADELGPDIVVIDPAEACAEEASATLQQLNLKNSHLDIGVHKYFVSDDPGKFQSIGRDFLGEPLVNVHEWKSY